MAGPFKGSAPARAASTNGWDVVSAVRIADVNMAIALAGTTPPEFSGGEGEDHVAARFGPWEIGGGGDGANIHMLLPLEGLTLAGRPLGAAIARVNLRLRFAPPKRGVPKGRDLRVLQVDPVAHGAEGAVQVLDIDYDERPDVFARAAVATALGDWLDANIGRFAHVFACVDLTRAAPDANFAWLKPSAIAYAMADLSGRDPGDGVFGILCRTAGRVADRLEAKVSAAAIPNAHRAAILISQERFMTDMLAPALPHAFEGVTPGMLVHKTDPERLVFSGEAKMKTVTADGKTYEPYLTALDVALSETELALHSITKTTVLPGIWSMTETNASYVFGLLENRKGETTMGLSEARTPTSKSWHEHSKGIVILEWILAIIGIIAGLVLAVVTLGLATVPAYAVAAALVGAVGSAAGALIIAVADAVANDDGPPLSLLLTNATDAVTWAHGSVFEPDWGGLNGALQFAGRLGTEGSGDRLTASPAAIRAFQARFGALEPEPAQ